MEDFTGWFRIFNLDGTLESKNRIGNQHAKNSTASKNNCSSTIIRFGDVVFSDINEIKIEYFPPKL